MLDVETAGDRPATKSTIEGIEVTPEMIKAGATELRKFNHRFESYDQGAIAIFQAMIANRWK